MKAMMYQSSLMAKEIGSTFSHSHFKVPAGDDATAAASAVELTADYFTTSLFSPLKAQ